VIGKEKLDQLKKVRKLGKRQEVEVNRKTENGQRTTEKRPIDRGGLY